MDSVASSAALAAPKQVKGKTRHARKAAFASLALVLLCASCGQPPPPSAEQMPALFIDWLNNTSRGAARTGDDGTLVVPLGGVNLRYRVSSSEPECAPHDRGLQCSARFQLTLTNSCDGARNYNQAAECLIVWRQPRVINEGGRFLLRRARGGWEIAEKL